MLKLRCHVEREQGQVLVETAIVLPLMIFAVLGVVQITMMQQARLMLEYAAFKAARTGIVWNGDPDRMWDAAEQTLLPTYRRSDSQASLISAKAQFRALSRAINSVVDVPMLEVQILEPQNLNALEVDFDDPARRGQTLLKVQVRYLYKMRIPFANWIIHTLWMTSQLGIQLSGWTVNPRESFTPVKMAQMAADAQGTMVNTYDLGDIWTLRSAPLPLVQGYYFPMTATYTMRMQSNPFKDNIQRGRNGVATGRGP